MGFSDEELVQAWKELPEELRTILFLVDVKHLSPQKVARMMDLSVETLQYQACSARTLLKNKLTSSLPSV